MLAPRTYTSMYIARTLFCSCLDFKFILCISFTLFRLFIRERGRRSRLGGGTQRCAMPYYQSKKKKITRATECNGVQYHIIRTRTNVLVKYIRNKCIALIVPIKLHVHKFFSVTFLFGRYNFYCRPFLTGAQYIHGNVSNKHLSMEKF